MADKKQDNPTPVSPDIEQFKKLYQVKEEKNGKRTFEMTIKADAFQKSYDAMLQQSAKDVNIKGFRSGKVPTQSVESHFKTGLIDETFKRLANIYVLSAIYAEGLHPLIPARIIEMPKVLLGTDIKFEFEVISQPDFKLADPKKIKVKKESVEVTDEEIDETLKNLDKQLKTQDEQMEKIKDAAKTKEVKKDQKNKKETKATKPKKEEETKFDDEWAKSVGKKMGVEEIKKLKDLKELIKEQLKAQKTKVVEQNYQKEILTQAVEKSKITVPEAAVEYEAHQREHSFMDQLEKSKVKLEQWLEAYSTDLEELKKAWKEDSEQALKEDAYLTKYAKVNEIEAKESEIEKIAEVYKKQQKDFEATDQWKAYMTNVLTKQKAFEDLLKKVEAGNK